ncbi:hypothetical protein V8C35DRAFT_168563 [Trichoderma chlorosporum]
MKNLSEHFWMEKNGASVVRDGYWIFFFSSNNGHVYIHIYPREHDFWSFGRTEGRLLMNWPCLAYLVFFSLYVYIPLLILTTLGDGERAAR